MIRKGQELQLPKMSTSRKTLSARLQRKMLSLNEKIKLLYCKKSNPMIGCRNIAETFDIGKTSAATIIKRLRETSQKLCQL